MESFGVSLLGVLLRIPSVPSYAGDRSEVEVLYAVRRSESRRPESWMVARKSNGWTCNSAEIRDPVIRWAQAA